MAGERINLELKPRDQTGSGAARRLRSHGLIPGVLYGNGRAAQPFVVDERELRRALTGDHGLHAILDVAVEDGQKRRPAVLKDYQVHPVRGNVLHVDLQEVRLDRPIQAQVAVELVGEPEGVTAGGVLTQAVRELTVEALPMEVPEHLSVDVSHLGIGDSLHLSDVAAPDGVTLLDDPETVLASVTQPTRVEVPEEILSEEEAAAVAAEVPPEERPEGAADQRAEPEADAAGSPGTVSG